MLVFELLLLKIYFLKAKHFKYIASIDGHREGRVPHVNSKTFFVKSFVIKNTHQGAPC
jgi:hypothetical protein